MIAVLVHNRAMYAVIMAGGGGTRLWPLSRRRRPKPFLPLLDGGRCLLEATVERLAPLIDAHDVYVVTDARYAAMVREVAPDIPDANIIGEPMGRNTAAAVALVAHVIDRPADEVMVVLPADQAIRDEEGFRAALSAAAGRAAHGDMVTLGVKPTEPATGYGYIVAGGTAAPYVERETYSVARFEEKPTPERAQQLVESGSAYWNAGIFVWQRAVLTAGLEQYSPDIDGPVRDWVASAEPARAAGWPGEAMAEVYRDLRATSIDYALLEPASLEGRVAVVPASIGWSDLGSWSALRDHRGGRGAPVISEEAPARVIDIDGRDVLVHAAGGRLVSSAEAAQDVKKVVDRLKEEGRDDLL